VAPPDALTTKILSEVAALARDLTRGELAVRVAAREALPLALTIQHTAAFAVVITPGQGALPASVVAVGSMEELQAQLEQRLQAVRAEAGSFIDKWVVEHGDAYRSALPPERCMLDRPVLGFQEVCPGCHGRKELTCNGCGGRGRVTCGSCGGRGRVTCSSCGGSRQTRCFSCGGSGTHEVREMELTSSDRQGTMNQQMQMTRRVPCPGCGGSGTKPCGCDGTQACGCTGGQVTCGRCGGRGIVACDTCAATGVVNHTGRVQCSVNRDIRVTVGGGIAEDQQTFRERVPFERIGALAAETGGVRLEQRNRAEHAVTLDYSASVPLECAECTVRGKAVAVRAYGAGHDIYDYHELVGTLLEPDVAGLEQSLSGHSLFRTASRASLAGVTKRVLASVVNALIAEAAPRIAEGATGTAQRRPSVVRVIGQALVLAPLARRFRRAGLVLKIVMAAVGLGMLFRPLDWYPMLAFICLFVEWRYQRNPPPPATPERESDASVAASARAAAALQKTIATGMVSATYVQRAGAAIGKAVPRLYGPLVAPMVGWLTAGVAALSVGAAYGGARWTPGAALLAIVALSVIAWFIVERRAQSSLKAMLGDTLYQRLKDQLGKTRDRYRLLGAAGLVVGLFLGDVVVRFIAHVRYGTPFPW